MEEQIYSVALQLWSVTLDLGLERVEEVAEGEMPELMISRVELTGAWAGAIDLCCAQGVVERAAASMFGLAPSNVEATHLKDALGELTNVIGGNIKRLLPKPTDMSTPSLVTPAGKPTEAPSVQVVCRSEGEWVEIRLIERGA